MKTLKTQLVNEVCSNKMFFSTLEKGKYTFTLSGENANGNISFKKYDVGNDKASKNLEGEFNKEN